MLLKKINFTLNQLIGSDMFIGYHVGNWNPMSNFFLLGSYRSFNIFNINFSYLMLRMTFNVLNNVFVSRGNLWVVYEKFQYFFDKVSDFGILDKKFSFLKFYNKKWPKGLLSNSRHVIFIKKYRFPRALFLPNVQNDAYVSNEASIMGIPTFGICDSNESPFKVFYSIPGNTKSIRSIYFIYLLLLKNAFFSRNVRRIRFWKKIKRKLSFFYKKNKLKTKVRNLYLYKNFYVVLFFFFFRKFINFRFANKSFFDSIRIKNKFNYIKFSRRLPFWKKKFKQFFIHFNKKKKKKYLFTLFFKDNISLKAINHFTSFMLLQKKSVHSFFLIKYFVVFNRLILTLPKIKK